MKRTKHIISLFGTTHQTRHTNDHNFFSSPNFNKTMTTSTPSTPRRKLSSSSELLCPPPLKRSRVDYESDASFGSSSEVPPSLLMPLEFEEPSAMGFANLPPPRFLKPRRSIPLIVTPSPVKRKTLASMLALDDVAPIDFKLEDESSEPALKRSRSSISLCAPDTLPRFTDKSPVARCA